MTNQDLESKFQEAVAAIEMTQRHYRKMFSCVFTRSINKQPLVM
jgi:hypothetical protein